MNMPASDIAVLKIPASVYSRGDKTAIARDFGAATCSYDRAARLQRQVGEHLLSLAPEGRFDRVADLGSGTGLFLEALSARLAPTMLSAIDLSPAMLAHARQNRAVEANWICADAERLPVPSHSQDVVFSSLMIQWCDDPQVVLRECRRVLRPGGWLLCSTLLDGTLRELEQAWALADPGVAHVNRFETLERLRQATDAVFPGARVESRGYRLAYDHPSALLRELKALGAHHKSSERRTSITGARRLKQLYRSYPKSEDGVSASYEAGFIVARSPV